MKLHNSGLLLLPVILFMMLGCCDNKEVNDVEADIASIRALYDTYIDAVNTNNLDQFMTAWDDDATRLEAASSVIVGKENIRDRINTIFEGFEHHMVLLGEANVEVHGDYASGYGTVIFTSVPDAGGDTIRMEAKWLDCLKRQTDGSWKIYIDCVNFAPDWSNEMDPEELEKGKIQESPY